MSPNHSFKRTYLAVWHQSTMLHDWLSLAAIAFATYEVFAGSQLEVQRTDHETQ
jgi:hypothetical protein